MLFVLYFFIGDIELNLSMFTYTITYSLPFSPPPCDRIDNHDVVITDWLARERSWAVETAALRDQIQALVRIKLGEGEQRENKFYEKSRLWWNDYSENSYST